MVMLKLHERIEREKESQDAQPTRSSDRKAETFTDY